MALFHQGNDRIQVWQIGIASALLVVGFCMASLSIPLIYSDMIGARLESVGLRSGWFFGLSSLAVRSSVRWQGSGLGSGSGLGGFGFGCVEYVGVSVCGCLCVQHST